MATHSPISLFTLATLVSLLSLSTSQSLSSPIQPPFPSQHLQESFPSSTASPPISALPPILRNLGFRELSVAASSLGDSIYPTWDGPLTLFAPSDASLQLCGAYCSVSRILQEHIIPGFFPMDYLAKLDFGTKIETIIPGRCLTITSTTAGESLYGYNTNNTTAANANFFINGAQITQPDVFDNGLIVIHQVEGVVTYLSPLSCNVERSTSFFPSDQVPSSPASRRSQPAQTLARNPSSPAPNSLMRLMLRDATLRLRNNGFSVLSLALRVKYAELVTLHNMTIFTLDDASVFSGGQSYVSNVRFHIVPNLLLRYDELVKLPAGTALNTLVRGEQLVVTTSGMAKGGLKINYMPVNVPDVMYNLKMVVHSIYLPFPHIPFTSAAAFGGSAVEAQGGFSEGGAYETPELTSEVGSCDESDQKDGNCGVAPVLNEQVSNSAAMV